MALAGVSAGWGMARLTGQQLLVSAGSRGLQPVPLGAALVATAVGGLAAYGLARLAARSARPRRTFAVLTATGLLLSTIPPVHAAVDVGTAVWLLVLHGVVAVSVLPPAASLLPGRSPQAAAVSLTNQEQSR